jgi:DNA-binding transcriptional regulator LsrR (DeoR family)
VLDEELVTYSLNFPVEVDEDALAEQVREKLGLERVVLVPSFYGNRQKVSGDEQCKNLAMGAADKLPALLGDAKTIGVGWGRTIYNASLYVRPQPILKGRVFVPLTGLSGDNNPMLQVNTIVDRFGERFHAERKYVNLQSLQARASLSPRDEASINSLLAKWDELDAAIVGVGNPPATTTKTLISEFPKHYKKQVQSSGAVGDILSQFFYEDGRILEMDTQYRLLALDINRLRRVKNVIAMATGQDKCRPICAAARLGYIKSLVTDYDTAKYILTSDM